MSRAGKSQAQHNLRNAKQDKAHWLGKLKGASHPTEKATYQRGVDRANKNIAEAQRQIDRHS